jgi:hypothetical protein
MKWGIRSVFEDWGKACIHGRVGGTPSLLKGGLSN